MPDQSQSVLVTGGAGFIGSHLVESLVDHGQRVTVLDNLSTGSLENIRAVAGRIRFHQLDIRDPGFTDLVSQGGFDVIFHLAANAYVPPSVADPAFDFRTNLEAPFRLLETIRIHRMSCTLIVASSAAVYGSPASFPVEETDPTVPVSPYGVSKLATERYVAVYSRLYGIRAAALRFFSVYGPRQRKQIVYDFMVKLTRDCSQLEILGDGTQVRDLVFVEDVAAALQAVADRGALTGEVYNVGTGRGYTTAQLAEAMCEEMGLTPQFRFTGNVRSGDAEKWTAATGKLRNLGFFPQVPLEEGFRRTVRWFISDARAKARNLETPLAAMRVAGPQHPLSSRLEKRAG